MGKEPIHYSIFAHQLRQLGDVRRNPPRFIGVMGPLQVFALENHP
jgi:hypothetical protein